MDNFPIVDTHVHLWHPKQLRYPWLKDVPNLNKPFLLQDYSDAHQDLKIESIVFVQCDTHPDDGFKETSWVTSLAIVEPRIKGIVAWAPLEEGEQVAPFVEKISRRISGKGDTSSYPIRRYRFLHTTKLCKRCEDTLKI